MQFNSFVLIVWQFCENNSKTKGPDVLINQSINQELTSQIASFYLAV